jgi:DNA repair protein RadD
LIVAPTAAGKSLIISAIASACTSPVLVLQPNVELLTQNYDKLKFFGGSATVYSASAGSKELSHFTYAMLGSIKGLGEQLRGLGIEVVLIDECDRGYPETAGSMFMNFIADLKPKKVIGLTATPFKLVQTMEGAKINMLTRLKSKFYKKYIHITQIQEMVRDGFWSPCQYETYTFDEKGLAVNTSGSDYTEESVREAIKAQGVNNNIYKRILQLQEGNCNSILVFLDSIDSCKRMVELPSNYRQIKDATYVDGTMPINVRKERVVGFKSGKYKVMFNYGVFVAGFDYPDLRCVIVGRPTMSLSWFYQVFGRGTRISPETGKTYFRLIDFCNNVERFGRIEDLTIRNIDGWGVGLFNGDYPLTNVLLDQQRQTIQELLGEKTTKKSGSDRMPFGKFSGQPYGSLPISYVKYLLNWDGLDPNSYVAKKLREIIEKQKLA